MLMQVHHLISNVMYVYIYKHNLLKGLACSNPILLEVFLPRGGNPLQNTILRARLASFPAKLLKLQNLMSELPPWQDFMQIKCITCCCHQMSESNREKLVVATLNQKAGIIKEK